MIVRRFKENPLITPKDIKPCIEGYEVIGAFNAGAVKYQDKTLLLMRVAERPLKIPNNKAIAPVFNPQTGIIDEIQFDKNSPDINVSDPRVIETKHQTYLSSISYLRIATSENGRDFKIQNTPAIWPGNKYETFGLEDPRITKIDKEYYITYKSVSELGICTSLIKTNDFENFHRMGIIFCPENLDVAIFPEKINGKFYALTRPVPRHIGPIAIWLASSTDLKNWEAHRALITPRPGHYDSPRVGASCVPIKTPKGWLEIYHGADFEHRYCVAAALLDLNDPSKVLAYTKEPIMQPMAEYELHGFFGNVVFPCGAICNEDGIITIYYGASDESTAAAQTSVDEILSIME